MKKLLIMCCFMVFFLCLLATSAWSDGEIIISIKGNCNRVGVMNVVEGDVVLNGKLYKSKVTGIGIYVPAGTHQVQVNGYCFDQKKNVARDIGVWHKTVKIKDGQKKKYTAEFK